MNLGGSSEREGDEDESQGLQGDREHVSTLDGHETELKSVAYSCNGTLLASCGRDKTVWIWEVQPDAEFECLGILMHHSQDVKHVAWHPKEEVAFLGCPRLNNDISQTLSEQMRASASYDDTINLHVDDPDDDWYPICTLKATHLHGLVRRPCGNYLASSSDDLTVRIWHRERESTGDERCDCVKLLRGHERAVYSVSRGSGKVPRAIPGMTG